MTRLDHLITRCRRFIAEERVVVWPLKMRALNTLPKRIRDGRIVGKPELIRISGNFWFWR